VAGHREADVHVADRLRPLVGQGGLLGFFAGAGGGVRGGVGDGVCGGVLVERRGRGGCGGVVGGVELGMRAIVREQGVTSGVREERGGGGGGVGHT